MSERYPEGFWFFLKVDMFSHPQCWLWLGAKSKAGYGLFKKDRRSIAAHRVAYEYANGPIPRGTIIRHTCDTPLCVNPEHLVSGTHADNVTDRVARNRSALGSNNGRSKLDEASVRNIRESTLPAWKLARTYRVSEHTINAIVAGKIWRHLLSQGQNQANVSDKLIGHVSDS